MDEAKFWARVNKDGPVPEHMPHLGPCWVWTGAKHRKTGYGLISGAGPRSAHRMAYALQIGAIPDGLFVCHHCDNKLCTRGTHLFAGTAADNAADKIRKKRHCFGKTHHSYLRPECVPRGEKHWANTKPELLARLQRGDEHYTHRHPEWVRRGEANPASKLDAAAIREIRRSALPAYEIAEVCGVTARTVRKIRQGTRWGHAK